MWLGKLFRKLLILKLENIFLTSFLQFSLIIFIIKGHKFYFLHQYETGFSVIMIVRILATLN